VMGGSGTVGLDGVRSLKATMDGSKHCVVRGGIHRGLFVMEVLQHFFIAARSSSISRSTQAVPARYRSLAGARLRADCPCGNAPTPHACVV
jgi:hypothetical protein